jgi:hypothetical protein
VRGFGWRLLVVAVFLPLALVMGTVVLLQGIAACLTWVACGSRAERVLLGPPACWLARLLDTLVARASGK